MYFDSMQYYLKNVKGIFQTMLISFAIFLSCVPAYAENIQEYKAEGMYVMSKDDTLYDAEQKALREAKRTVAELAGTYIESSTTVENNQLTKDEIFSMTSSIISVKDKSFEQTIIDGQIVVVCRIIAEIDVDKINNKMNSSEFKLLRKDYDKLANDNRAKDEELKKLKSALYSINPNTQVTRDIPPNTPNTPTDPLKYSATTGEGIDKYVRELIAKGDKLRMSKNYHEAIRYYSSAAQYGIHQNDILLRRGICYYYIEDYKKAADDLNKLNIDYNFPYASQIFTVRGLANEKAGNYETVTEDFTRAKVVNPEDIASIKFRMAFNFKRMHWKEAIDDAKMLLDNLPQGERKIVKDIYMLMAICYDQLRMPNECSECYQLAVENGYTE